MQLDHSVIGGSAIIDRYMGQEAFMPERAEMVQYLANHIDEEVSSYQSSLA